MPEFLVELYAPRADVARMRRGAQRARQAAAELSNQGTPVRYVRSIFVPDDETCFHLYRAGSVEAVREVESRAGLRFERISKAVPEPRNAHAVKPRACAREDQR
jgi:hypothetical protein